MLYYYGALEVVKTGAGERSSYNAIGWGGGGSQVLSNSDNEFPFWVITIK